MKISLNWLQDYVQFEVPVDEVSRAVTFLGFEVEQVLHTGAPRLDGVVVGEVLAREKHPNADRLSVCQVDVGPIGGIKTIVCGAQNYRVGDRIPVALPGAVLPGDFTIRKSKIRGQSSEGMLCSPKELGVADDAEGLLILDSRPEIGTPINEVLPAGDVVFDVEITPNRPDCLSHLGLARELAAWFRRDLSYPEKKFRGFSRRPEQKDLLRSVRVMAPEDCPLYTAQVITGVRIAPSPGWMQERLRSVGLRPINNIVDIGNYVMLETGQPLHAFDARRLGGGEIVVRHAAEGESIVTLDGRERQLSGRMLVIADASRPVVIAGIMGGEDSGVSEDTTDLVLECAVFRGPAIRRTSRQLGLASESSYRFERGVDPHRASLAAERAIELILELAGGEVAGPGWRLGADVPWSREIVLTPAWVRERLGFEIPDEAMKASLESLELEIVREEEVRGRGPAWTVSIPSWRDDLDRPIDLVEEILRLHGTDRIPPGSVISPGIAGDDDPVVRFNRRVTEYLVGHDFHECVNLTLRGARELATWVSEAAAMELALANPFVDDQSHLRPTLVMGMLDTVRLNQSRGVPVTRLCEVGRVFVEVDGHNYECASAAFLMVDGPGVREWLPRPPPDFFAVKHHVEALAAAAGVDLRQQKLEPISGAFYGWQEGHSASAGDLMQGWRVRFGLLNLAMVQELGISGKVYAGVLAVLPSHLEVALPRPRFRESSSFPAALRDLALIVDEAVTAGEVRSTLEGAAQAAAGDRFAVERIEVFDVYQGSGLPAGSKSLAFSLSFRAADRTLTDEEVNAAFDRIQEEIRQHTSFQIRK